jgi:hypothetical protein
MDTFPADVYTTLSNPGCVAAVMGHSAQAALANTLFHMKVRRSEPPPTSLHPALQRHTCGYLVLLGRVTCPPLLKWFNLVGSSLK